MEENTQLPKEVVKDIAYKADEVYNELNALAVEADVDNYGLPTFNKVKEPIEKALTAYATKLHQANEKIKSLTYDNNKLKGQVEGLTKELNGYKAIYEGEKADRVHSEKENDILTANYNQLLDENKKLKTTATGWRPLLEDILRDNNDGYIDIDEALCSRIKTFLYGD